MHRAIRLVASIIVIQSCQAVSQKKTNFVELLQYNMIEGWFSDTVEWEIYPTPSVSTHIPFHAKEDEKCISLVNRTGQKREKFKSLHGRRVRLTGKLVRYADLDHGDSAPDRLLSKRYYEGVQIQKPCSRCSRKGNKPTKSSKKCTNGEIVECKCCWYHQKMRKSRSPERLIHSALVEKSFV